MKIRLKFYGLWESMAETKSLDITLPDNASLEDVLNFLSLKYKETIIPLEESGFTCFKECNGRYVALNSDEALEDKATLLLLGPIEGG